MKALIPVWPWPMHPKVAEVLNAIPDVQLVEARPGGPGPVLAIGKPPTFACDALVVKSPEKAAQAVAIIAKDGIELWTMGRILGLKELAETPNEKAVKFQ